MLYLLQEEHGKIEHKVYTTIDYVEKKVTLTENMRDNLYGPLLISQWCKERSIHFTYLETECIFKFDENHPFNKKNEFDENSSPNFFGSSYSIVKGLDRLRKFYDENILNVRIRMPITGI